jgi:hypothetical protein
MATKGTATMTKKMTSADRVGKAVEKIKTAKAAKAAARKAPAVKEEWEQVGSIKIRRSAPATKPAPTKLVKANRVERDAKGTAKLAKIVEKANGKPAKAKAVRMVGKDNESVVGGVKAKILAMMQRKGGASAAEICAELGWVQCGATISRTIKAAPVAVRKERVDGVLRYIATA